MFEKLLPKEEAFFVHFNQMMENNRNISLILSQMVNSEIGLDEGSSAIQHLENETRGIARTTLELLHKTFITPIERDDIFNLVTSLESIAKNLYSTSYRLSQYKITEIRPEMIEFTKILLKAIDTLSCAIENLNKIKKNEHTIKSCCSLIHRLEDESDDINRSSAAKLFDQDDIKLLLKWKAIFERMERAADKVENAANIIENILIDHA